MLNETEKQNVKNANYGTLRPVRAGWVIFICAFLFLAVTMPFRRMFALTAVTEVRPVSAFPPAFGLLFGVPGALGCALGNLAADLLSGYSLPMCIGGFFAQFLYGYLPYLLWYGHKKNHCRKTAHLNNTRHVLRYIIIVAIDSLYMTAALGILLMLTGSGILTKEAALLLFFNNLVFCLILGIPIIIAGSLALESASRKVFTLNVRFVLIFLCLSVISATAIGVLYYRELSHTEIEAVAMWNRIYLLVSLDFFLLCGISLIFLRYLEKNITVPIEKLSLIAEEYAEHRRRQVEETTEERQRMIRRCEPLTELPGETGLLAEAFRRMFQELTRYIDDLTIATTERERIRTEIGVASRLQADMLPEAESAFPDRTEFVLAASMTPAKGVGGDFYDFFLLDEDHLALIMADVSGKGIPAALFMVVSRTFIRGMLNNHGPLTETVEKINEHLCRNNPDGMFVTAWIGILTISTGDLDFVNAGHCRPFILHADGTGSYEPEGKGLILAGMEGVSYRQFHIQLNEGEGIFLYTDGVTEATDVNQTLYGEERLKQTLCAAMAASPKTIFQEPKQLLSSVWDDVDRFQQGNQFDDITMLALFYKGSGVWRKTFWLPGEMQNRENASEDLEAFRGFIEMALEESGIGVRSARKILMAADEIYSNICFYSKACEVTVTASVKCVTEEKVKSFRIRFEDNGFPYNPLTRPDPEINQTYDERAIGGLGIYLVKKRMDKVDYEYVDGKNCLTMEKKEESSVG